MGRKSYLELCDKPAFNGGSETAPPFAVLQVTNWTADRDGNDLFTFKKPDGKGKFYLVNGPFPIPAGKPGDATTHDGAYALYEGSLPSQSAESLAEWGPKSGSWAISKDGKGFVIVGDPGGSPGSQPGFPAGASTQRVRVVQVTQAKVPNRIQGTVAMTVTPSTQSFPIQDISVLSGTDPRPEPHSPAQQVTIQNNLRKAYANGQDRVIATQSDADLLWYVETPPAESNSVLYCEATENKGYQNPKCLAKPVTIAGAIDNQADPIYLVDDLKSHYIRKAESGANGYRFHAVRFTEDYSEGIAGYRIIAGEGPALRMIVKTGGSYIAGGTTCTVQPQKIYGSPTRGRRLPPSGNVTVADPLNIAKQSTIGDMFEVGWEEENERYIFVSAFGKRYITVRGTGPSITRETPSFALGNLVAVNGDLPAGESITVTNDPPLNSPGTRPIYARYNLAVGTDDSTHWDTGDAGNFVNLDRGLEGFIADEPMVHAKDAGGDPKWFPTTPCTSP